MAWRTVQFIGVISIVLKIQCPQIAFDAIKSVQVKKRFMAVVILGIHSVLARLSTLAPP